MTNAIILAAGFGSRLKPLTSEVPKCLTEINGEPILLHDLKILEDHGIKTVTIVIGYLGHIIRQKVGDNYGSMKINYIDNPIFDTTNSMYSLWLAKDILAQGSLVIEGDTIFDEELLSTLLATEPDKSYWCLDQFTEEYTGSMSISDPEGRIEKIEIVRGKLKEYKDNFFKSTGVLKISSNYGQHFAQWLDQEVQAENTNIYYDLVLAKHLNDADLHVCDITNKAKWAELDNFDDVKRAERIFKPTKYVIVIVDGAADLPIPELNNKTPFEAAQIPNIDRITAAGKTGLIKTSFQGLPVGSIVANMGILGYNPLRYYPNGRASFEALAQNIHLGENDLAFRCNLLTAENGHIKDFTADNIECEDAKNIINNLKLPAENMEIYPGLSYRNLIILRNIDCAANEIIAPEPHSNVGEPESALKITATTDRAQKIADLLNKFMEESKQQIAELNKTHNTKATRLAIWSPSNAPVLSSFHKKFGLDGSIITGMHFLSGIGTAAAMRHKIPKGATGYSNTDMPEKLRETIAHLQYHDFVFLHINAPDEESHNKDTAKKVAAIERIDREVVGPLLEFLDQNYANNYKIAVMPDHYTFLHNGKHGDAPVPYTIYGKNVQRDHAQLYSESEIEKHNQSIINSYEFMDFFLRG